ncbi:hypothetical protein HF329_13500 [Chitinophaga oryzae]|uniref:DUF5000 domain-containing protein n=1 Tax=Chitinophaga oryzae TaxID=2725414 RepID=A0AAE6ZIZ8_9BACT|nr:DUF4998 domain-containing protein [Chitinophaga oryzae]QJB32284.1 hypothetical protein HF329_13500 [Chitinophaga oryzae]
MKYTCFIFLWLLGISVWLTSCTKGDAFKKYMEGGEITYPGRVDTVLAQPGYGRIQLLLVPGNDPLVTKFRIFWNSNKDSVEVPAKQHSGKDTLPVLISGLPEGNYNFTVYSYDKDNNRSVIVNVFGTAYGKSYAGTLVNRTLKSVTQSPDGQKIFLNWGEPAAGEQGIEVTYVSAGGTTQKIIAHAGDNRTVLPDYAERSPLTYRSMYKPDTTAFEFFYPELSAVTLPAFERELSKADFKVLPLPTDVKDGGYGWLIDYLWDNNYDVPGFATQSVIPCWFTIDVGTAAPLSRFKVWQAADRLYNQENVKTFELYGSNSPAPDGSWNSWTMIGAYESVKPSGLPVGQLTDDDITFAKNGESFSVPPGTTAFRYYRFRLLTNWGGAPFMTMGECTFYTHSKK